MKSWAKLITLVKYTNMESGIFNMPRNNSETFTIFFIVPTLLLFGVAVLQQKNFHWLAEHMLCEIE